jgi:hypothetical protein
MLKVKKLKIDMLGKNVPNQKRYTSGNVGVFVEDLFEEAGFTVNRGDGCDLPFGISGVDIKTRNLDSDSPHTVGTMTTYDICNTPYKETSLSDKLQQQYRVHYRNGQFEGTVKKAKMYDFSDDAIQSSLELAYESAREKMQTGIFDNAPEYTRVEGVKGAVAHFEKKKGNSWAFRVTDKAMKRFEAIDNNREYVSSVFN